MKKIKILVVTLILYLIIINAGCVNKTNQENQNNTEEYQTITDMDERIIQIPKNISRVIDVSDGFITSVMRSLGIVDKIVGLGSRNLKEIDNYTFETITGENYSYIQGMNPVTYLEPWMKNLPAVAEYGEAVNYETIASLNPDVVIIRIGFCSMNTDEYGTNEDITRAIDAIEALGFPVVILKGPPAFSQPTIQNISQEIRIIGQIFGKENEAATLISYLEGIINMIKGRTMNITETEKPTVLLFGLSPNARETGGAGDVLCRDTIESHLIEDIINAKNAINEQGGWKIMSTEQILAVNPDVIVLPTDWGYHPPKELYTASYYQNLQELEAVKNHRVWALPWTPYNCAKRLEYPIEVMVTAKAAYPQLFNDIKIHDWVLDFYKTVYHVDNETAISLRSMQWLDWTVEEDV